jgi:hypothetical protein
VLSLTRQLESLFAAPPDASSLKWRRRHACSRWCMLITGQTRSRYDKAGNMSGRNDLIPDFFLPEDR